MSWPSFGLGMLVGAFVGLVVYYAMLFWALVKTERGR